VREGGLNNGGCGKTRDSIEGERDIEDNPDAMSEALAGFAE